MLNFFQTSYVSWSPKDFNVYFVYCSSERRLPVLDKAKFKPKTIQKLSEKVVKTFQLNPGKCRFYFVHTGSGLFSFKTCIHDLFSL